MKRSRAPRAARPPLFPAAGPRDLLVESRPNALDDCAMNLALNDHRVDYAPAILGDDVAVELHLAGFRIDLQCHNVRRRGRRAEYGSYTLVTSSSSRASLGKRPISE
jgi:hypothetical protein